MSGYLSKVLETEPELETTVASGGSGAIAPVLKVGDIQPPTKTKLKPVNKQLKFSNPVEDILNKKRHEFNAVNDEKMPVDVLRAVYRRGAGSYDNAQDVGNLSRHDWAMARVNAFAALMSDPESVNPSYVADYDLLPSTHELSTRPVTASATGAYDAELSVSILPEDEYETFEQAVFNLAEYTGLGYETIPAIRAAWMRGIKNNENPFERAAVLASALYNSPDADLLPKKGIL